LTDTVNARFIIEGGESRIDILTYITLGDNCLSSDSTCFDSLQICCTTKPQQIQNNLQQIDTSGLLALLAVASSGMD